MMNGNCGDLISLQVGSSITTITDEVITNTTKHVIPNVSHRVEMLRMLTLQCSFKIRILRVPELVSNLK